MIKYMIQCFRERTKLTVTLALGNLCGEETASINNFLPVEVSSELKLLFKMSERKLSAALVPFNVAQGNNCVT